MKSLRLSTLPTMTDSASKELQFDETYNDGEQLNASEGNPSQNCAMADIQENEPTPNYPTPENQNEERNDAKVVADAKVAANDTDASERSTIDSQVPSVNANIGKPSSFAQIVRTWETYINDGTADQFQPLNMFQQLNLCGTGKRLARLTGPPLTLAPNNQSKGKLLEPVGLRHTHSTPLRHTPSILDDDDEDLPPPIGLDILSRSRSTPLSTSANSAFGTILRTMPYMNGPGDRSAFTLPPYRLKPTLSDDRVARRTTFNPIQYDKEMETELTSIEVMDMPTRQPRRDPDEKTVHDQEKPSKSKTALRAAKFLSDVRNLRRRRRVRTGRENPARPASLSDDSAKKTDAADEQSLSSKSSASSKDRRFVSNPQYNCKDPTRNNSKERAEGTSSSEATSYHQIDSDHEEGGHFPRRDVSVDADSPATIPSPVYHQMEDDHDASRVGRVRIQVSNSTKESMLPGVAGTPPYSIASPEPAQMARDVSTLTPHSQDSPGTSRCSGTTYTSGHTTHATSTTYSSGQMSHLSAISETDLEVMEANNAGKLLRGQEDEESSSAFPKNEALQKAIPLSSSRNARIGGYIELADSPVTLRDGASVPAERFFTLAESPADKRGLGRLRTSSLKKGIPNSPTTVSSSSMNTNSSASSTGTEPPAFVSYLDKKTTFDLTSLRESVEASSPRAGAQDLEKRESSPAELLGYSDVIFEEAQAPKPTTQTKPRPIWPAMGLQFGRRVRSLPPRSPHKGGRTPTTTPPQSVSPAYSGVSPPRNIVDHRIDANVSRPYVLRSTPASTRLLSSQKVSPEVLSSSGDVNYAHIPAEGMDEGAYEVVRMGTGYDMSRNYYAAQPRGSSPTASLSKTYNEHSIEILKTDSKEESSPTLITPEKGTSPS
jgi:hypothetical protein